MSIAGSLHVIATPGSRPEPCSEHAVDAPLVARSGNGSDELPSARPCGAGTANSPTAASIPAATAIGGASALASNVVAIVQPGVRLYELTGPSSGLAYVR